MAMPIHDIVFYGASFFLIGVAAASLGISLSGIAVLTLLGGVILFFWKKKASIALVVLLPVVFAGYGYFNFYYSKHGGEYIVYEKQIDFEGMVSAEPMRKEKVQELTVSLYSPYKGKIKINTALYPVFNYGDILAVGGTIEESSYGTLPSVGFPKIKLLETGKGSKIMSTLFAFRRGVVANIESALPLEEAALLAGETVGDKSGFTKDFKDAMAGSGTSHIVALSGYNISILAVAVSYILGTFLARRKAFYVSVLVIITFVLMTGAEASVVRAAIMGVLVLLAERTSRLYSLRNALVLAAFLMVLSNPKLLAFDAGFELSFGALLGIVYLAPAIKLLLKMGKDEGLLGWKTNGIATVSAQFAVAPILIGKFGQLTLLSVFANILILGVVPITMFFGFVIGMLGFVSYHLTLVVGWFAWILLHYQIFIIKFFANIAEPVYFNSFPFYLATAYYGAIVWFIVYSKRFVKCDK